MMRKETHKTACAPRYFKLGESFTLCGLDETHKKVRGWKGVSCGRCLRSKGVRKRG